MRILIVEDDKDFRGYLRQGLKREGFAVDEAGDAQTGSELAANSSYDLILLDIKLPGKSGDQLLRSLRERGNNALIFMLTGQEAGEAKLQAYDGGADDYLVKPVKLDELVAKIRAWLKRRDDFLSKDVGSTILAVADLQLDLLKRRALRGGQMIPLTAKECAVLEYLMRNKGRIKSQTAILEHISNVDFDGTSNTVEFHIKNLREKIDKNFSKKLIQTVRGSGYMIESQE